MRLFKDFYFFLLSLFQSRYIISQLVKRDFQNKYLGSFVGLLWVFLQPAIYIFVLWFALSVGLKTGNIEENIPYHLWLISGLVPWMFMSELMGAVTNSISEYAYLIKKVMFRSSIIPIIKVFTSIIIQLFFIGLVSVVFIISKIDPTIYWFQVFYYLFAAVCFLLGFIFLTSSLSVFVKDIPQIVNVIIQIMFWLTPIIWYYKNFPQNIKPVYSFNPLFYIIRGYRDSFLSRAWFWEHRGTTIFFWVFTLSLSVIGSTVFRKLKPHFADVL